MIYFVDTRVLLFQEKLAPYDLGFIGFSTGSSTNHVHPFLSQNADASSLSENSICIFDNGSPLEDHPIKAFSQRSLVSNSIFHFFVLFVPDCIEFLHGLKILTRLLFVCSSGTPEMDVISSGTSTVMVPFIFSLCASSSLEARRTLRSLGTVSAAFPGTDLVGVFSTEDANRGAVALSWRTGR